MSQHGEEACHAMSEHGEEGPVLERVEVSFKNFMLFMVRSRWLGQCDSIRECYRYSKSRRPLQTEL